MKKLYLILFSLLSVNAFTKTSIGLKVGLSSSQFRDDYYKDFNKRLTGVDAGIVFEQSIYKEYLWFRPEVSFVQKGAKAVEDRTNYRVTEIFRINYVEFPLLLQGGYSKNKFSVYAQFGPYVSIGVSGKDEEIAQTKDKVKLTFGKTKNGADIERLDAGLQAGLGGSYKLGKGKLEANLRFGIGLNKIDRLKVIQNRTIQFTVGYLLPIGKNK